MNKTVKESRMSINSSFFELNLISNFFSFSVPRPGPSGDRLVVAVTVVVEEQRTSVGLSIDIDILTERFRRTDP